MLLNNALIKGDMKQVRKLMKKGNTWVGPKDSYKGKRLSSESFRFPTKRSKLAECLLTVLDLKLVDWNDEVNGINWIWFLMFDKSKNPVITSDHPAFADCYDAYVTADKKVLTDEDDISRPQLKVFFDDTCGMYRFIVEQYDGESDPIVYNDVFDRENAILLLSKLLPYTNGPYSC